MMANRKAVMAVALALVLLGMGTLVVGFALQREIQSLESGGVVATATLVNLVANGPGARQQYRAFLEVPGNPPASLNTSISSEQFAAMKVGDSVRVTYLPGQVDVVVLGDAAAVTATGARALWATWLGGGAFVIGALLGLFGVRRSQ
jgi:hypothetical protein